MPTARLNVASSTVNGKIYAIGGSRGGSQWYLGLSTVEEYDPATDTWTRKADMRTGRTYFSTSAVNGKIYAIGGVTTGNNSQLASVEEYDPATDTWTPKAAMPTARSAFSASAANGKIYAIGGSVGGGAAPISTVEEFDPYALVVDLNGDGIVDGAEVLAMVDCWGTDDSLCDIGPMPGGDGVVDVEDLKVLAGYIGQEVDDPTLVAHWAFDEIEGTVAGESVGTNDGAVVGNAQWQPDDGVVGGALAFDGTTFVAMDFVLSPSTAPSSVLAWVKGGLPGQAIVSQQAGANWLTTDPATGALMTDPLGGRNSRALYSDVVVTDGDWHRVAVTWDDPSRRLYVDGVLVAEDTQAGRTSSDAGLFIGCGSDAALSTFFAGLIDDVRIYRRAVKP
jgi:hypothetical protein